MQTICFLGDSITMRGYWTAEIFETLRRDGIRMYNCGVSGDNATNALSRLYTNCLCRTPDTVSVMFGVNDICWGLYVQNPTPEQRQIQVRAIENYKCAMRALVDALQEAGVDVILCTPPPYNDTDPDAGTLRVNDGLEICAAYVKALAEEYALPCVDMFGTLRPLLGQSYTTDPDRVHPTRAGEHMLAQVFLQAMGYTSTLDTAPYKLPTAEAEERFTIENRLRLVYFVEWNQMYSERIKYPIGHTALRTLASERLAKAQAENDEPRIRWYGNYLNIIDHWEEYENDLVRLTMKMAKK